MEYVVLRFGVCGIRYGVCGLGCEVNLTKKGVTKWGIFGNWRFGVWPELTVEVYRLTNVGDFNRDFGLKDQVRRAAVSIVSNIAEGEELGSNKQSVRFFYIAKGSIAEVQTQMEVAVEIGYVTKKQFTLINAKCDLISKKLRRLIQYRTRQM